MNEALLAAIKAHAGIAAIVEDRALWGARAQGMALPCIVLTQVSRSDGYHMKGRDGLSDYVVQIDCWGRSYLSAKTLSREVVALLDTLKAAPLQAFLLNERDDWEAGAAPPANSGPQAAAPSDFYRTALDVRVWTTQP